MSLEQVLPIKIFKLDASPTFNNERDTLSKLIINFTPLKNNIVKLNSNNFYLFLIKIYLCKYEKVYCFISVCIFN